MSEVTLIDVRKEVFEENDQCASEIRANLNKCHTSMINLMGSPGCGKTTFLLRTIKELKDKWKIAVIEGDLDSLVDSKKIIAADATAVQINTGGACHLEATVVQRALNSFPVEDYDLTFVENIGNLVCPAEFDIGESLKVMILSVPEGDDKILKYPLMFSVADVLIVTKTDYLPDEGFSLEALKSRAAVLNPSMKIIELSARTGDGFNKWVDFLNDFMESN